MAESFLAGTPADLWPYLWPHDCLLRTRLQEATGPSEPVGAVRAGQNPGLLPT